MKLSSLLAACLLGIAMSPVHAQCSGTPLTQAEIMAVLNPNGAARLVCGRPGAGYPGSATDRWQEEHLPGGALFDFKRGTNPIDPRKQVGTWFTSAGASRTQPSTISHAYTGGPTFTWTLYGPANNVPGSSVYSFCTTSGAEHVRAFIVAINASLGCNGVVP